MVEGRPVLTWSEIRAGKVMVRLHRPATTNEIAEVAVSSRAENACRRARPATFASLLSIVITHPIALSSPRVHVVRGS